MYTLTPAALEQRRAVSRATAELRRAATHCKRGHEFTPENTYVYPNRNGKRRCRTCQRDQQSYYYRGMTIRLVEP